MWQDEEGKPRSETGFCNKSKKSEEVAALIASGAKIPHDSLMLVLRGCFLGDNYLALVEMLIASGADIEIRDPDNSGWTPVMCAAFGKCPKIVRLLIEKGANTSAIDDRGCTVFGLINSQNSATYNEVVRVLVDLTIEGRRWLQTWEGRTWEQVNLVDLTAPIPSTPLKVTEILQTAMSDGDDNLQKIIRWVESGGDLQWRTPNGWTLLHLAAQRGNEKMVRFLLGHGAEIESLDTRHETPLMLACDTRWVALRMSPSTVARLLDSGANPNVEDIDGITALRLIQRSGMDEAKEIAALLEEHGAKSRGHPTL